MNHEPETTQEMGGGKAGLTPMVRQYNEVKARNRDKILLFRVGDFYEMFYTDAEEAARILHIALTARNDMPMAGFPYHAAPQYIHKLIAAGRKVAVCEQVEDPATAKGLVRREIVSVVTPATVTDENFLDRSGNNFLCALALNGQSLSAVFADVSTHELFALPSRWFADPTDRERQIEDELCRFMPSEILVPVSLMEDRRLERIISGQGILVNRMPDWYFTTQNLPSPDTLGLPPEALGDQTLVFALYGMFRYLSETQGAGDPDFMNRLRAMAPRLELLSRPGVVEMDDFTIRNLELVRNMQDQGRAHTLLHVLDKTLTSMGGRFLKRAILLPLTDIGQLRARQNAVETFSEHSGLCSATAPLLKSMGDLDRLAARLGNRKAIPRDLVSLARTLTAIASLSELLAGHEYLAADTARLDALPAYSAHVERALLPEPSSTFNGEVVRPGYSPELDQAREIMSRSKDYLVELQARERERTGIASLKVKYNGIFGYFIEISKANADKVPSDYIRKQSLVNAERFTIPELSEYEEQIHTASERVARLEETIFNSLVEEAAALAPQIKSNALSIGRLDFYRSLGVVAAENRYVKPRLTESGEWIIVDGRHPVVESYMGHSLFVANDTRLGDPDSQLLIITGPNMAGKSTYLRQNALFAVMAQMGSFVPARSAEMGLVDRIFTRIGASDNLSQGQSTFLVEMQEAANILKNATPQSLIIMDELGRGTSTYDGLSIAWAVVEYLLETPGKNAKTLFATHYHELTRLGGRKGVQNLSMAVREYNDELVFLRKVIEGPADRSYGIYVAQMAGIPGGVIEKARKVLDTLEKEGAVVERRVDDRPGRKKDAGKLELSLFPDTPYLEIIDRLKNVNPDTMTPLEALTFLSELRKGLK